MSAEEKSIIQAILNGDRERYAELVQLSKRTKV